MKALMKSIAMFVLSFVLVLSMFSVNASALGKGQHVGNGQFYTDMNTDGTHIYVMGASFCVQMFNKYKSVGYSGYNMKGAAIALWGGHYGGGKKNIDSPSQIKTMEKSVKKHLQTYGKASVFVFATMNAWDGKGNPSKAVTAQLAPAKKAYNWTATYKGKTVRPTVYCTSMITTKGKNPSPYNKKLKQELSKTNIKYIDVSIKKTGYVLKKTKGSQYDSNPKHLFWINDYQHFSWNGAKSVWNKFYAVSK